MSHDPPPTLLALLAGAMTALLALLTSPGEALAQAPSLDAPPPTSLVERRDDEGVTTQRAPRSAAHDPSGDALRWPALVPAAMIVGHIGLTNPEFDSPGYGLFLGANYYPWPDTFNAFWSAGLKVERNTELRDRPWSVVPTVRSGFAWLHGDPQRFVNRLMPNLQVYGLAGYHIPVASHINAYQPPRWRTGLGLSSPRLSPATGAMLLWGVPMPNMIELAVDLSPDLRHRELMLMMGIGL